MPCKSGADTDGPAWYLPSFRGHGRICSHECAPKPADSASRLRCLEVRMGCTCGMQHLQCRRGGLLRGSLDTLEIRVICLVLCCAHAQISTPKMSPDHDSIGSDSDSQNNKCCMQARLDQSLSLLGLGPPMVHAQHVASTHRCGRRQAGAARRGARTHEWRPGACRLPAPARPAKSSYTGYPGISPDGSIVAWRCAVVTFGLVGFFSLDQ